MSLNPKAFATWIVPAQVHKEPDPASLDKKKTELNKYPWAVFNVGKSLRNQGEYARAVKYLNQARSSFEQAGDEYGMACSLEQLAFCSGELSRNSTALEYAHQAVTKFSQLGRDIELAWAYENLAYIYFYRYRYRESLNYTEKARAVFSQTDSKYGLAWNACNMARIYLDMSLPEKALEYYNEAASMFAKLENEQGVALSHLGLGTVYRSLCDFDRAKSHFSKAKAIYAKLKIKDHVGWCVLNEAALARAEGRFSQALALNKKANQTFSSVQKADGIAWSYFQSGQVLRDQGFVSKSWQVLREGLNLHRDINNRKGIGWGEDEWGVTYFELNDLDRSMESFNSARTHAEQMGIAPLIIDIDKNLGLLFIERGRLQEAHKSLQLAWSQATQLKTWEVMPEVLLARIRYHILFNEIGQAWTDLQEVRELTKKYKFRRQEALIPLAEGELYLREGKVNEAFKSWTAAKKLAEKYRQRRIVAEATLGLVQLQKGKTSAKELLKMVNKIEKESRALSSRKLKGKCLLIRAWLILRNEEFFDTKTINQALQVFASSGLYTFHWIALKSAAHMASNDAEEKLEYERMSEDLLKAGTTDLGSIFIDPKVLDVMPSSVFI